MSTDLFRENIIDHYKNPRNFGVIEGADYKTSVSNATCGDEIELGVKVLDGKVLEVKHQTRGCAICTASMSMLSERLKGIELADAQEITAESVLDSLGINKASGRIKCALLPHDALVELLKQLK